MGFQALSHSSKEVQDAARAAEGIDPDAPLTFAAHGVASPAVKEKPEAKTAEAPAVKAPEKEAPAPKK